MSPAIRFDRVSKRFTLHHQRPRSFQELVIRLFQDNHSSVKPDCETGGPPVDSAREEFWALRDVSFAVEHGETVGIIGPNGAGKSTALKLISRIIEPTSGEISVDGRVGALLELGAGFHPDLSGRENVYLNGSILGLSRAEINRKLDCIVTFAELERFIDMPIRHYSSGMRMRLGFSIAAHIDPEILLVDEVLAVGDENFQHKCLDRIMEMRRGGVTICFVSHGLGSVRRLCSRAIWLNNGTVRAEGAVDDVISAYLRYAADEEESRLRGTAPGVDEADAQRDAAHSPSISARDAKQLEIVDVSFVGAAGVAQHVFRVGEPWGLQVDYRSHKRTENPGLRLTIQRNDGLCVCDCVTHARDWGVPSVEEDGSVLYQVDQLSLMEGTYLLSVSLHNEVNTVTFDEHERTYSFKARQVGKGERYGLASLGGTWEWRTEEVPSTDESGPLGLLSSLPNRGEGGRSERQWGTGDLKIVDVSFLDEGGTARRVFETGEPWTVRLRYRARRRIEEPVVGLAVHRDDGVHVCGPNTHFAGVDVPSVEGEGEVLYKVDHLPLVEGAYHLSVSAHNRMDTVMYDYHDRLYGFKVAQFNESETRGVVTMRGEWRWQGGGMG